MGTLYLCATPIGNLEDITLRALRILKEVDIIACEDTRVSAKLLSHYDIHTKTTSYHEHNKKTKGEKLLEALLAGKNIALITDAGMPGISDPGEDLVKACLDAGVEVTLIPGASAGISALVLSGLSTRRYIFEGFLPANKKERQMILSELSQESRTMVFYEAPHRLESTLEEIYSFFSNRNLILLRELTKKYEERMSMTLDEAIAYYKKHPPKGEYVLVLEGKDRQLKEIEKQDSWKEISVEAHMKLYEEQGLEKKEAIKKVAKDRGVSKRDIYAIVMRQ